MRIAVYSIRSKRKMDYYEIPVEDPGAVIVAPIGLSSIRLYPTGQYVMYGKLDQVPLYSPVKPEGWETTDA